MYSYIKEAFQPTPLSKLSGKRVGIDAMCMLYQAYFSATDNETEFKLSIIRQINQKIQMFKDLNIEFVFIIDGLKLNAKKKTDCAREQKRNMYKELAEKRNLIRSLGEIRRSRDLGP